MNWASVQYMNDNWASLREPDELEEAVELARHGTHWRKRQLFYSFRSPITSRKRRYGCENDVGMVIFGNTWIGEWEYNSDIGAIFALLNGLSLIFTHNVG